jgi:hypothetical protein
MTFKMKKSESKIIQTTKPCIMYEEYIKKKAKIYHHL